LFFSEKRSGGGASKRPVLEQMLAMIRSGDTVVVYKLDHVARSLKDLLISINESRQQAHNSEA